MKTLSDTYASLTRLLDRVPMHLLVQVLLLVTVLTASLLSYVDVLAFDGTAILLSAALAVLTTVVVAAATARLLKKTAHHPSSVITGLIIALVVWPGTDRESLQTVVVVAAIAGASKFLLVWRHTLIVNPAVVALVLVGAWGWSTEAWWVASKPLAALLAVGALLVLYRTRLIGPGLTLIVLYVTALTWGYSQLGVQFADAWEIALFQSPPLFLAGFMFSEPVTLPGLKRQRYVLAVVTAVLAALPVLLSTRDVELHVGSWAWSPAFALLITNVVAFLWARRTGVVLNFRDKRSAGHEITELRFEAVPALVHAAGQWAELSIPHRADVRGQRRVFSISSAPGSEFVTIGVRAGEYVSSFKRELLALKPGQQVRVVRLGGDFTPQNESPRLLIAAGVGVTPFLSHISHGEPQKTTLVLLLRNTEIPFRDQILASGVRLIVFALGAEHEPQADGIEWHSGRLTPEILRTLAPDIAEREVMVSGSSAQAIKLRLIAREAGARRIKADEFAGY